MDNTSFALTPPYDYLFVLPSQPAALEKQMAPNLVLVEVLIANTPTRSFTDRSKLLVDNSKMTLLGWLKLTGSQPHIAQQLTRPANSKHAPAGDGVYPYYSLAVDDVLAVANREQTSSKQNYVSAAADTEVLFPSDIEGLHTKRNEWRAKPRPAV